MFVVVNLGPAGHYLLLLCLRICVYVLESIAIHMSVTIHHIPQTEDM